MLPKIPYLKQHLCKHFQTKDLRSLKYFLGIEVAQSKEGSVISERKYGLDILKEIGMIDCRQVDSHMDLNEKWMQNKVSHSHIQRHTNQLWKKLIYLSITGLVNLCNLLALINRILSSTFSKTSKRLQDKDYLYEDKGRIQISRYRNVDCVRSPIDKLSTIGYCFLSHQTKRIILKKKSL